MLLNPRDLFNDLHRLEEIEKASLRLVVQAVYSYRNTALDIFRAEGDLVADIGEDVTREALDKLGMSRIDQRLFGKIDYKRARYLFHPDFAIRQALFVDSKAEKREGQFTATLQTSQFSLIVRQIRSRQELDVHGDLPVVIELNGDLFLTTTIFVKYTYEEVNNIHELRFITVASLPNGYLQELYNPNARDSIWLVGRNSPTRGESFRVRLDFRKLKQKSNWRVQHIPMPPDEYFWED